MSAHLTFAGLTMADGWPMARVLPGASAAPIGHAIDLAFLFDGEGDARQDSLMSETRRQLGGCVASVETALRLSLAHAPDISAALDVMEGPVAWDMIRAHPTLVSPALLAHMRMRAAVVLMLREFGRGDVDQPAAPDDPLPSPDHPLLGEAVAALAMAEGRWLMSGGELDPIKPDIPADLFTELVWTVAACLLHAAARGVDGDGALFAALDRSAWAVIADHDEASSPIAQAERLVRRMGEAADDPAILGLALESRRFLMFCALAAHVLHIECHALIAALLVEPVSQVAMLSRALGGSDANYRLLLLALRPVRPSLNDAALVRAALDYADVRSSQADAAMIALRTAPALRARLSHLQGIMPA